MTRERENDDATERRLRLLVGLVVVLALAVTAGLSAWEIAHPQPRPSLPVLVTITAGIAIACGFRLSVRIRATDHGMVWSEVPILIGLTLMPGSWLVLCTAVGLIGFRFITGRSLQKDVFAVAKGVLSASASAIVFLVLGTKPNFSNPPFAIGAILLATLTIAVVDDAAYLPVVATASHSTIRRMLRQNLDIKLIGYAMSAAASVLTVGILSVHANRLLLLVFPLIAVCIYIWLSRRLHTRLERDSWQHLAMATEELNSVELTEVLQFGVYRAAQIFSALEAEIDLAEGGTDRVVRGTGNDLVSDGRRRSAVDKDALAVDLVTYEGEYRVGTLRLRFGGPVKLSEFEQYKLRTFASALCTAIRNATAYAELERLNEENAYAARHDALTGLANRRELYDRTAEYFAGRSDDGVAALLLIDLNHFKEVNDTLGHSAGDMVLCRVADRLSAAATDGDLVARLGGDEFAVLLTGLRTPALANHRASSMLAALEPAIEVEGLEITVEAAAGIALAAGTGGINELLRRADVAMYQAKRSGQATATYAHSLDTADVGRLALGGDLRRAVSEHEFVVDFQPIVDLGSGEVIAAEALARWHHPEQGFLSPLRFLETVERSGQLPAFADAVLGQALTAAAVWREAGFDLPVAVNVSPRSLLDPKFPAAVLARLEKHNTEPGRLLLELAETLTISQLDVVGRALAELNEAGVRLALDDFGTGVSPLSVLSHIPVHQLKIDREFVGAVETSSEAAAVIRSTVDLARSLQLTVIAEGVESEPQRHALWELGCVAGQGHLFARPMSSARLLGTLQRGSGGRAGVLADSLHAGASVVRLPRRRSTGPRRSALPDLPA